MLAVRGIYDGRKVELLEKVNIIEGETQEVIVTFLNEKVEIKSFDLHEFLSDWSSEEIQAIGDVYSNRETFFQGREFDL